MRLTVLALFSTKLNSKGTVNMVNEYLLTAGAIATIAVPVCAAFRYVVIKPLSEGIMANTAAMEKVNESLTRLNNKIDYVDQRREELQERVVIVEQSTKSAHHRLDNLQERVDKL